MARSLVSQLADEFHVTRMHVRNIIYYNRVVLNAKQGENGRWSIEAAEDVDKLRKLIIETLPNVASRKRNHGKEAV